MSPVSRRRDVSTGSEAVWRVLAAFDRIAEWAPNVDHSCLLTDQEWGVGAVRRVQVGRAVLIETVRSWEPGSSLSYAITGLPKVVRSVVNTWQLDPFGSGTRVTLITDIDTGPRPPQQLIARFIGRKLAEASDEMLDGLVAHVTHVVPRDPTHDQPPRCSMASSPTSHTSYRETPPMTSHRDARWPRRPRHTRRTERPHP